jgi:hypothetical protein
MICGSSPGGIEQSLTTADGREKGEFVAFGQSGVRLDGAQVNGKRDAREVFGKIGKLDGKDGGGVGDGGDVGDGQFKPGNAGAISEGGEESDGYAH